jgi:hypothetical protein
MLLFEIRDTPSRVIRAKSADTIEKKEDRRFGDAKECVRV